MLKSILVAIDGTKPSEAAQALSIDIARRLNARVAGIGVLDKPWITAPQVMPIGGAYYKMQRDRTLLLEIDAKIEKLLSRFEGQCRKAGVEVTAAEWEGDPAQLIAVESEPHDLIAIGKDTTFHFRPDEQTSDTVMRLARDDPRPILVTPAQTSPAQTIPAQTIPAQTIPAEPPPPGKILVAFDGSLPASRAMHMLALLGLAADRDVEVVTVSRSEARSDAQRRAQRATKILTSHGVAAQAIVIESSAHPAETLIEWSRGAAMLAMGAFGQKTLRDYFFGSCTKRLLEACPVPLFIHH